MGLFFRKSVEVLPGVRLNAGKKGISVSIGQKGAKVTYGKGRKTVSAGIPGTGVYFRNTVSTNNKQAVGRNITQSQNQRIMRSKAKNKGLAFVFLILGIPLVGMALLPSFAAFERMIFGGIGLVSLFASYVFFTAKSVDVPKDKDRVKHC